jgi:cell wall-associated NlpC family hydrolase
MQVHVTAAGSQNGVAHNRGTQRRRRTPTERARGAIGSASALLLAFSALCGMGSSFVGSAQAATTQAQAIVNAAASMRGKPYCFDGGNFTGPTHGDGGSGCGGDTRGFDCSGLALYAVYQGTGGAIRLPHKASEEALAGGQVISSQSALEPGDLVFFGGGSMAKAVHVAIYAGRGEVWVAEDYGIPVRLQTLRWIEHGLPFDGGVRYWSAAAPSAPAPSAPTDSPATAEPAPSSPPSAGSTAPTPAPAAPTYAETTGSVVHTWSDYSDAGGSEGPEVPSNDTVQIACKVEGFAVADGNTWWYRIASTPWGGTYYGSADAFYNDGATSGSLLGTPFVDPAVPNC